MLLSFRLVCEAGRSPSPGLPPCQTARAALQLQEVGFSLLQPPELTWNCHLKPILYSLPLGQDEHPETTSHTGHLGAPAY
jgi:hypothetical protein